VLHVAEGLETALAVRAIVDGSAPVWSTLNKGLMQRLDVPEPVQCLVIWADRDHCGGGEQAAQALAERLHQQGPDRFQSPCRPHPGWSAFGGLE